MVYIVPLTAALFLYKPESLLLALTSRNPVMPEHCTIKQQQQGWHVAGNLPRLVWLCRDTYPNQHVGITVRALIYRWMDRDAAGVPQVPVHDSSGLLPTWAPL